MDPDLLREALDALADGRTAAARRKEVSPLKGVRGVPDGEIARIGAAAWEESELHLDADRVALQDLFSGALEDGLLAIGLVAAALPDDPEAAYEIGLDWLSRVDDTMTADALGTLVLGPGVLAAKRPLDALLRRTHGAHESVRRAIAAAAMAWLPEPVSGPAAAPLRARLGQPRIAFVEAPLDDALTLWMDALHRDEGPAVRKALRRILRTWAKASPAAVAAWGASVQGGLPKMLGDEVRKATRRAGAD